MKSCLLFLMAIFVHFEILCAQTLMTVHSFEVRTYDNLSLPAQVIEPAGGSNDVVLLIKGSTPYDETVNQAAIWTGRGQPLLEIVDFYQRFQEVMPMKGYMLATVAKRSFVYPEKLPRPNLNELALDIVFFINELRGQKVLTGDTRFILAGYSEGSTVATKVLGFLKKQPDCCILLGSAGSAFDYQNLTWREWPMTGLLRRIKGWSDNQIQEEYQQFSSIMNSIHELDEQTWEYEYKKSRPYGFGFAPWESLYIDKEIMFYDPVANIQYANIPVLICVGEDDMAMPESIARRTYTDLRSRGFQKASFRVIPGEVHQYKKYDVFAIMDSWIQSGGENTAVSLSELDERIIAEQKKRSQLKDAIKNLPYEGENSEMALECFRLARANDLPEHQLWFSLAVRLFGHGCIDEALYSFRQSDDPDFPARYAALVWQGHLCDLNGDRDKALKYYDQALRLYPGFAMQHDLWNIKLDEKWITERMQVPFVHTWK